MNRDPVRLAIVGHTNTGKTSLMRTLTRDARFGEVSDRPATTRDVQAVNLLAGRRAVLSLFDTPGLEDPGGLREHLDALATRGDPVARIESFLSGDHDGGRYEQEAKVLRQLRRSDAALYVVDAREPVLAKHHEELRLLADCGRPLLPVLNFVAGGDARTADWREALARSGLHVMAPFDTVVFDDTAEQALFDKLKLLLELHREAIGLLMAERRQQREQLVAAACRAVAELLLRCAGARLRIAADADAQAMAASLRDLVRSAEQRCIDDLLAQFRFDLDGYQPPDLPLQQGRWALDAFDPEALRQLGIRGSSAVAAGALTGLSLDAMVGGASLGAGAVLGAAAGAAVAAYRSFGRGLVDRLQGYRSLVVEETTLALLASRQTALLRALLRRGHASTAPIAAAGRDGWPSPELRAAVTRGRAHPEWSDLNAGLAGTPPPAALQPLVAALHRQLIATGG